MKTIYAITNGSEIVLFENEKDAEIFRARSACQHLETMPVDMFEAGELAPLVTPRSGEVCRLGSRTTPDCFKIVKNDVKPIKLSVAS